MLVSAIELLENMSEDAMVDPIQHITDRFIGLASLSRCHGSM